MYCIVLVNVTYGMEGTSSSHNTRDKIIIIFLSIIDQYFPRKYYLVNYNLYFPKKGKKYASFLWVHLNEFQKEDILTTGGRIGKNL
jgi:hypothetical protein